MMRLVSFAVLLAAVSAQYPFPQQGGQQASYPSYGQQPQSQQLSLPNFASQGQQRSFPPQQAFTNFNAQSLSNFNPQPQPQQPITNYNPYVSQARAAPTPQYTPAVSQFQGGAQAPPTFKPAPVHYVSIGAMLQGDYKFGYDAGNGAFREESRLPDGTVTGAYGYTDPLGKQQIVKYSAGKDGFKVLGDEPAQKPAQ